MASDKSASAANNEITYVRLQPLLTDLLMFRQPLLPCLDQLVFATRCHCDQQFAIDMRKLAGPPRLKAVTCPVLYTCEFYQLSFVVC